MLATASNGSPPRLAVVHHPDVHAVGQAALLGSLARERGLRLRERDPDHVHAVVLRCMEREAAPAAADVEHALAVPERELRADQLQLGVLGLLERGRSLGEQRAAVGHRLAEHEPEEVVGNVVVVAHRAGVAFGAVAAAARAQLGLRNRGRTDQAGGADRCEREPRLGTAVERRRLPGVQQLEHLVEVVNDQLARHVGATQPELAGGPQCVSERVRGAHAEGGPAAVRGLEPGAVPELHGEGARGQGSLQFVDEGLGLREHGVGKVPP